MFSVNVVILFAVSVFFSRSVECFIRPSQIRSGFSIVKPTKLMAAVHEAAEKGDLEKVIELVTKDPSWATKYDIDGKFLSCANNCILLLSNT